MSPQRRVLARVALVSASLTVPSVAAQESRPAPPPAPVPRPVNRAPVVIQFQGRQAAAVADFEMQRLDAILNAIQAQAAADPDCEKRVLRGQAGWERTVNSLAFGAVDEDSVRANFDRQLGVELGRARRYDRISPAQEARLRLAAEGDMKRYFDRVARARREFASALKDPEARKEWLAEIRRLKLTSHLGPFDEGSIYAKVLERVRHEDPAGAPSPAERPD